MRHVQSEAFLVPSDDASSVKGEDVLVSKDGEYSSDLSTKSQEEVDFYSNKRSREADYYSKDTYMDEDGDDDEYLSPKREEIIYKKPQQYDKS